MRSVRGTFVVDVDVDVDDNHVDTQEEVEAQVRGVMRDLLSDPFTEITIESQEAFEVSLMVVVEAATLSDAVGLAREDIAQLARRGMLTVKEPGSDTTIEVGPDGAVYR